MKAINEIIRGLREDKDIKQCEIAKVLDMSQQQYSRYETGESELPLRVLRILADYYKVSADYLMDRKGWENRVPELDKKVTNEYTAREILNDILSLNSEGRAAVAEYISLQKMKQASMNKEENDSLL